MTTREWFIRNEVKDLIIKNGNFALCYLHLMTVLILQVLHCVQDDSVGGAFSIVD
jgi:hypothetical protein